MSRFFAAKYHTSCLGTMFLRGGIFDRFVKSGRVGGGGIGIPKQSFYQLSLTSSVFYKGDRKGESKGGMVFKKGGVKAEKGSQKGSYINDYRSKYEN